MNEAFVAIYVRARHNSELIIHLTLLLGEVIPKVLMHLQCKTWNGSFGQSNHVSVVVALASNVVETQFIAGEFLVCELVPSGELFFGQCDEPILDLGSCGDSFNHAYCCSVF